jgi:hypothetical protein
MDLLQKEHERLWKKTKASKSINDVQATIDLLQEARNTVAAGESSRDFRSPNSRFRFAAWVNKDTNRLLLSV